MSIVYETSSAGESFLKTTLSPPIGRSKFTPDSTPHHNICITANTTFLLRGVAFSGLHVSFFLHSHSYSAAV